MHHLFSAKILALVIALGMTSAEAAEKKKETDCEKLLSAKVREVAKLLGLKDKFGLQWADPVSKGKDSHDNPTFEYATGVFIYDEGTADAEGFIPDSGARAIVIKKGSTCKITRLEVGVGAN
jgi:alkyl sulfatase BDS1-like metallo-beta-lactamase superfamily hydrolase